MSTNMTGPEHYAEATRYAKLAGDKEDAEFAANLIELGKLHAKLAEIALSAQPHIENGTPAYGGGRALAREWNRVAGMSPERVDAINGKRG